LIGHSAEASREHKMVAIFSRDSGFPCSSYTIFVVLGLEVIMMNKFSQNILCNWKETRLELRKRRF
jgi:hypothetical protein